MTGTCALCLIYGNLCKSHIIPEFMYERCRDPKNRFLSIPTSEEIGPKLFQTGFNKPLLCQDCEAKIARHETYVASLTRSVADDPTPAFQFIEVYDYDYAAIKLFAVSLLWRCAVSRLQIYSNVRLGKHEEIMREMLLNDDPGPPAKYGLFLKTEPGDSVTTRLMISPTPVRTEDRMWAYQMIAQGIAWTITVSSHFTPFEGIKGLYVGFNNPLLIPVMPRNKADFVKKLSQHIPEKHQKRASEIMSKVRAHF